MSKVHTHTKPSFSWGRKTPTLITARRNAGNGLRRTKEPVQPSRYCFSVTTTCIMNAVRPRQALIKLQGKEMSNEPGAGHTADMKASHHFQTVQNLNQKESRANVMLGMSGKDPFRGGGFAHCRLRLVVSGTLFLQDGIQDQGPGRWTGRYHWRWWCWWYMLTSNAESNWSPVPYMDMGIHVQGTLSSVHGASDERVRRLRDVETRTAPC